MSKFPGFAWSIFRKFKFLDISHEESRFLGRETAQRWPMIDGRWPTL